jgi:hypothetical protein
MLPGFVCYQRVERGVPLELGRQPPWLDPPTARLAPGLKKFSDARKIQTTRLEDRNKEEVGLLPDLTVR